jgi:hypothetical protein
MKQPNSTYKLSANGGNVTVACISNAADQRRVEDDLVADRASLAEGGFAGVSLSVAIENQTLVFTIVNRESRDILVSDEFCYEMHLRSSLLELPALSKWHGSFHNGGMHRARRMQRVSAGGQFECGLIYSEAEGDKEPVDGLLIWHTRLFIGDIDGKYASHELSGALPVRLPLGSDMTASSKLDSLSFFQFTHRSALGVSPPESKPSN